MARDGTVFIVDDDSAMRGNLARLVEGIGLPAMTYCSAQEFLEFHPRDAPGCLVLDVRLPGMSGLGLLEILPERQIDIPVIIMTGHADVPMAVRAMHAGAFDFLEKPVNPQVLLESIERAIRKDEENRRARTLLAEVGERLARLSRREYSVLELVAAGYANKQIAAHLGVTVRTVELHRSHVMSKMQADSLADLVRMAVLSGIAVGTDAQGTTLSGCAEIKEEGVRLPTAAAPSIPVPIPGTPGLLQRDMRWPDTFGKP